MFSVKVGNLDVSYHNSNTVIVKVEYRAAAATKSDLDKIVEETKLSIKTNEEVLELRINKKDSEESIWEWLNKNISKYNISADVQISIPKQIQNFDMEMDVGYIKADGLQGRFKLKTNTGGITANNIRFTGNSTIVTDMGNVNLLLSKEEPDTSETEIHTRNGDIEIDVGNLLYEEEVSGSFSASKNKTIIISNKCRIRSSTDYGKIMVR
ncbi:MAG: DUF4097 family beta strand repeat-containing protein [Peptococcaceae bacterium]|nr:DUF4097 family beta strand repeat-containing protein [Peptococcaceae bacterium]